MKHRTARTVRFVMLALCCMFLWGCTAPDVEGTSTPTVGLSVQTSVPVALADIPRASKPQETSSPEPDGLELDSETLMIGTDSYSVHNVPVSRDGLNIHTQVYVPSKGTEPYPLVIIGHGFGSSSAGTSGDALQLAEAGIAACVFDFCGGSRSGTGNSDGSTTNMSVLTEENDMQAVLDTLRAYSFVDSNNIFLMGHSQGGFVAALLAARIPDEIRGLILFYPALVIPDDARAMFSGKSDLPATYMHMGMELGRIYADDVWDMDAVAAVSSYPGDVLILHGDKDGLVPISYSQQAQKAYAHAQLMTLSGAGHGFFGPDYTYAIDATISFVKDHVST